MLQLVAARPGGETNCQEEDDEKTMITSSDLCAGAYPAAAADPAASKPPASAPGFPQFALLPAELRHRIWHFYCAMTAAEPRVLDFQFRFAPLWSEISWLAIPGRYLSVRVRSANAALEVSRECRHFALQAFPDTLAIQGETTNGLVRFNRAKDVVAARVSAIWKDLDWNCTPLEMERKGPFHERFADCIIPGFSDNVENLAVDQVMFDSKGIIESMEGDDSRRGLLWNFIGTFRNLKTLYHLMDHRVYGLRDIHWCGSADAVHVYEAAGSARVAYGRRRRISVTTVWPDPDGHPDFARAQVRPPAIPLFRMVERYAQYNYGVEEDFWDMFKGVHLWPMVQFDGRSSQWVLERLRNAPCREDLPDEQAPSLDEPSCVATVDCDDPEGCLGHSADGDLEEEEEAPKSRAPEPRRDWKALHRAFDLLSDTSDMHYEWYHKDDMAWVDKGQTDPFDFVYNSRTMKDHSPMRAYPAGDLQICSDGTDEILESFSAIEAVERWLEGVDEDEGEQDLVTDLAECRLEPEAAAQA